MYTKLEDARIEVQKRFKNKALRREVKDFLKVLPNSFENPECPRAVMARQVATPNFESIRFWDMTCEENNLKPLWAEYSSDRFCTKNPDKMMLGKIVFYNGVGRKGGSKTTTRKIIDFDEASSQLISDICLKESEIGLTDFHHEMLNRQFSNSADFEDFSSWLKEMGGEASKYYEAFLSLFICHGILFETYLLNGSEGIFSRKVVIPAIEAVKKRFGLDPLIVRLLPEEEKNFSWNWYPENLEHCLQYS